MFVLLFAAGDWLADRLDAWLTKRFAMDDAAVAGAEAMLDALLNSDPEPAPWEAP
jgi:hypothetical protein